MRHLGQKATREQTRAHNSKLVLKTIYERLEISRADVARETRLTRTTVSDVVSDLMAQGLVEEVGYGPSEGGKPPILLSVADDSRHLIGIDLASDEFRGAVVNLRGQIHFQTSLPLDGQDGDAALGVVYDLVDRLAAATTSPLLGIGIGTPGLMDPLNGVVRRAVNLNWQDLPLRSLLEERYGLPVYVANDCHVAALAEFTFGSGQGAENLVVIKIDHGIGAGIVLNGRPYYGDTFGAGEIGHLTVVENGLLCRCGNTGCLETVASARAIVKQARAIALDDPQSVLYPLATSPRALTVLRICGAALDGDEAIRQVVRAAGHYLGMVVANMVGVLSVRRIFIAGSITCLDDILLDVIREEVACRALAPVASETEIEMSTMGADIVILGASALVLIRELGLFGPVTAGG
jgi:N-acetylglucosamine repressor